MKLDEKNREAGRVAGGRGGWGGKGASSDFHKSI